MPMQKHVINIFLVCNWNKIQIERKYPRTTLMCSCSQTWGVDEPTEFAGRDSRPTSLVKYATQYSCRIACGPMLWMARKFCGGSHREGLGDPIVENLGHLRRGDHAVTVASQSNCRHRVASWVGSGIISNRLRRFLIGSRRGYEFPHKKTPMRCFSLCKKRSHNL